METESITVDPFAKAKKLSFTDLTRAGNTANRITSTGERDAKVAGKGTEKQGVDPYAEQVKKEGKRGSSSPLRTPPPGRKVKLGGIPAAVPDSQNPLRFLIARSSEKPSKMDGNT